MNSWLKKFKEKFGFDAYDEVMNEMGKMSMNIERLKESRDNWKKKYMELKK